MDAEMKIKINLTWDVSPVKSGSVTVDDRKMDFMVHNGRLILSDQNASEETIREIGEVLKELTVNVYEVKKI